MTTETLYERIKRLSNVPIKHLEQELGLCDGLIQKWKKSKPSVDNFYLVAKRLGVSMEYLWYGEDYNTQSLPIIKTNATLSTELAELSHEQRFNDTAKIYKELPDEYRERAFGLIMGIAVGLGLNVDKILSR